MIKVSLYTTESQKEKRRKLAESIKGQEFGTMTPEQRKAFKKAWSES